ncbi:hypothetical protein KY290_008028 [Solanum tuberosum]|uniref:Uncharacterized protein n=1 Tax=Solanum tuberosum TaxID=4113 RepID=A0ABQ7W791_SOLTU|nr:hypothetical protein KY290_008028 [Solanum tuberosum]
MLSPLTSVSKVYAMITSDESQRITSTMRTGEDMVDNTALSESSMNTDRGHYNAKKKVNWNLFCDRYKMHGHNQKVSREDETADVFGLVAIGQKSTHDPYDLNSIRTNLQALTAQPHFTSNQYQKIVQLLNKEEKVAEMVNMAGSCVIPAAGDLFNREVKGIGKENGSSLYKNFETIVLS